jgi:hypothetical protein
VRAAFLSALACGGIFGGCGRTPLDDGPIATLSDSAIPAYDASDGSFADGDAALEGAPEVRNCPDPLVIVPFDAAPCLGTFSVGEIGCESGSDCVVFQTHYCACLLWTYGVNKASAPRCVVPGCIAPPPGGDGCDASGTLTQDCQLVASPDDVVAICTDHQCTTTLAADAR